MKLYLSGPMSGLPYFNIPAFDEAAGLLRRWGNEVVSPAELDDPEFRELCLSCASGSIEELNRLCEAAGVTPATWGELLARDTQLLADEGIECVVVLDGWTDSRGAVLETLVARLNDIPVACMDDGQHYLQYLSPDQLENTHARAAGRMADGNRTSKPELFHCAPPEILTTDEVKRRFTKATGIEVRVTSETGGQKGSKEAVIGDICPKALMQVARVAGMGRRKYERLNYLKGFDWSLSYDAAQRHLMQFWAGEDTDEESGLPHLAHAAWQCLCLLAFSIRDLGKDDRP